MGWGCYKYPRPQKPMRDHEVQPSDYFRLLEKYWIISAEKSILKLKVKKLKKQLKKLK